MLHLVGLYIRTVRYLKPIQIIQRIKRKIFPPRLNGCLPLERRISSSVLASFIARPASILSVNTFKFLNQTNTIDFPKGWNDPSCSKLWLYNLHYFDGLQCGETSKKLKEQSIKRWIKDNPPIIGNGWEPYANSLRIVNWIKWSLSGNELSAEAIASLANQSRYLMKTLEYDLLGNHLFVTLKGMIFAGCFFEGSEASKWLKICIPELDKQIDEQFLSDGAHFELSPMYHALVTEDLLDIINILRFYGIEIPSKWLATATKAIEWQQFITRPDGCFPLFNDAAYGIAPTLKEIEGYADHLGLSVTSLNATGLRLAKSSGYARFDSTAYTLLADVGQIGASYQPAHVHCDMLSFELFADGKPLIVDTGTSTYEPSKRRMLERSTKSHNTVQVNNFEQSEIWGTFRVGARAKLYGLISTKNSVEARHNGFKKCGVIHKRKFICEDSLLQIEDFLEGRTATGICRFHLAPNVTVAQNGNKIHLNSATLTVENASSITISDYDYAPEFNKCIASKVLEIEFSNTLVATIEFE